MRRTPVFALGFVLMGAIASGMTASAQTPPKPPDPSFIATALARLGLVFRGIGSLSGAANPGEVWRVTLPTGERQRIGTRDGLAWPVPAADGRTIFALRERQVVGIRTETGIETMVGAPADWSKLIGVLPDGTILGFVADDPRPRPALLLADGARTEFPAPVSVEDRQRNAALLQESRDYADGSRLEVRNSTRGGRGRDVFLISPDGAERNLTDCGDALCGQPSRGADGRSVFYVRSGRD